MHVTKRSRRMAAVLTAAAGAVALAATPAPAATRAAAEPRLASRQAFAKYILEHHERFLSGSGIIALQRAAGIKAKAPGPDEIEHSGSAAWYVAAAAINGSAAPRAGIRNVRVNDPSTDRNRIDQTTQSETSIAVAGSKVAVGYNDSQHSLLAPTAATNLTGYSYSTDGGRRWHDGGNLPNRSGYINFGDPWLTSDRTGRMYFSTLAGDAEALNTEIGVSVSTNGGRGWSTPTIVSPNNPGLFYFGDRESMTAGRDPVRHRDNLYVTWNDFVGNPFTKQSYAGLPIARSTDGGRTWRLRYVDRLVQREGDCSSGQYTGALPFVDPADGRLFVVAEKFFAADPRCTGKPVVTTQQVLFTSTDGGVHFSGPTVIAAFTQAVIMDLGKGKYMRTANFPVLAKHRGKLYATWTDGAGGANHVRLAVSADRGRTWRTSTLTTGRGEIQPAISADRHGLHLAYYQKSRGPVLDVVLADSANGSTWRSAKLTSVSFPGVPTVPQFDPVLAWGYMGDYIANVSDGTHTYVAWGDNRDIVRNSLWPQGRHDPDVFFARR